MPLLSDHVNPGELQMLTAAWRSSCLASQSLRSSCLASQRLTVCYNHLPLPLGYSMKHPSHYCISTFRLHTSAACQKLQEGDSASLSRTITKEEVLPSDTLVPSCYLRPGPSICWADRRLQSCTPGWWWDWKRNNALNIPLDESNGVVHGALLLGLVSGLVASRLPGLCSKEVPSLTI